LASFGTFCGVRHTSCVGSPLPPDPLVTDHWPPATVFGFAFPIPLSEFLLSHFPKGFERSQQLSVPGGLVAVVPPECRAAIQRRAVVPLVGLD
jgi:hypothetical protein